MILTERAGAIATLRAEALKAACPFPNMGAYHAVSSRYWHERLRLPGAKWQFHPEASAHIGYVLGYDAFFKTHARQITLDHRLGQDDARSWLLKIWPQFIGTCQEHDMVVIPHAYSDLLPFLAGQGYAISEEILGGFPKPALGRLQKIYGMKIPKPGDLGLFERGLLPEDAAEVVRLEQEVFGAQPWLCWFFNNPGFAESEEKRLIDEFEHERSYGLFQGPDLMGYYSYPLKERPVFFPKECGVDIAIRPQIQRKGMGKFIYQRLLGRMIREGIDFFKGGTANPSVLHLSFIMDRPVLWYSLRPRHLCPPEERFKKPKRRPPLREIFG